MHQRILLFTACAAVIAAQTNAAGLFDARRVNGRSVPTAAASRGIRAAALQSPEKMTELFGPSILVRDPPKPGKPSRFVTQP